MIHRIGDYKSGVPFYYVIAKTQNRIEDQYTLDWIKSLKIPPAYTGVTIHTNRKNKILAWGYDSKLRKQYIYNPIFVEKRSREKYNKIIKLKDIFSNVRAHIEKDLHSKDDKSKNIAIILYLIIYCGFRIGNKCYEKANGSYGISTIKYSHIKFKKGSVFFDFIGKKGVRNVSQCDNPIIFKILKKKAAAAVAAAGAKTESSLMLDADVFPGVSSQDVNNYLKAFHLDITTKDLRTWNANTLFIQFANDAAEQGVKDPVKTALEKVSEKLHNTVAVCKKNYVDPNIIDFVDRKIKNDI
jgi:DNA topoisomerase-1